MSLERAIDTEPGVAGGNACDTRPDDVQTVAPSGPALDPTWLCGLLQASDSFYPTGSYAHSFGLEGLVHEGVIHDRETLRRFLLLALLPALRRCELPLAAHAWYAFADSDWTAVGELSRLSSALRPAREARIASENIGRQRAELASALQPGSVAAEFVRRAHAEGWPFSAAISAAVEGRALGAPLDAVLAGLFYSSLAALLSAAMKLLRIGQNGAQSLMTELLRHAPDAVAAARQVPRHEIGSFNPWLDVAAARHETANARMFIS